MKELIDYLITTDWDFSVIHNQFGDLVVDLGNYEILYENDEYVIANIVNCNFLYFDFETIKRWLNA